MLASLALLVSNLSLSHHKTLSDMLTITVSHNAVGAQRYFREGLSKEGNYYLDQNIKSYYAGTTSRLLGIEGCQITAEGFARLSGRRHPEDDTMKLGVRDNLGARAGVDLTFSAPKCLSLLHAVTKDEELLAIHRRAYKAAMQEAEKLMYTQNNEGKKRGYIHTGNLVYGAFDHFLSRPMNEKV
ncbi:MAG: relaxase domain-containing protein, partial [Ekhidna sp.]|nr:relaxase domain-containing protein [Ekhidna sp.]